MNAGRPAGKAGQPGAGAARHWRAGLPYLVGLVGWAVAQPAWATDGPGLAPGMAAPGYTGLGMTPSATPASWGQVQLAHDQALPGNIGAPQGHNLLLGVGLLPGLEVSGRLATNDWHCNLYQLGTDPCPRPSQRDLSASVKLGHRLPLKRWPGLSLSVAAGATDLGGAATSYRSYYTVLGLDQGPWALHAGWARGVSSSAALHGGFGSLAWRPRDWLQLQAERIGHRAWLGGKLLLPLAWRPDAVEPWLSFQRGLHDDGFTPRQWWGVGVAIQLDRPHKGAPGAARPAGGHDATAPAMAWATDAAASAGSPITAPAAVPEATKRPAPPQAPAAANAAGTSPTTTNPAAPARDHAAWAHGLAQRLAHAGFEDISVGQAGGGGPVVIEAENSGYAWNDLDALGVAMGQVSQARPTGQPRPGGADAPASIDLRLMRRGIVVWQVLGSPDCIAAWLRAPGAPTTVSTACPTAQAPRLLAAANVHTAAPAAGIDWWVRQHRASWLRPRLLVAPDIDSRVGTEFGALDSTWGVDLTLQVPLWRGAHADLAYVQALGHSSDYDPGQAFADFRIDSQFYRTMLHQALDLSPVLDGLAGRVALGRLFKKLDGGTAELRWQPGDGKHRLGIELSHYQHIDTDFQKRSAMASYRYFVPPLQTSLELQAGRFWHGDSGAMAVSRHWFGDVSVALYLRRSQFPVGAPVLYSPYGNQYVNAAGVEFTFPLTPRREHVGSLLQLRGADRFGYGVQTVVGQKTSNNLTPWFGRFAPVPSGLSGSVDNFDRNSQAYLDSNLHRVRQAWHDLPVNDAP